MSDTAVQHTLAMRPIAAGDAVACALLSSAVGWPHRAEDWEMVIGLGHGVVATAGDDIVATAQWWPYGDDSATLGMIIVSPQQQGAGIGKRLMQSLFDQTQDRALMLNATEAGEPIYRRFGFVPCGGVSQYHGEALAVAAPVLQPGTALRSVSAADLPDIERLDLAATGLPRQAVLAALFARGQCVVLERDGQPVGFSFMRRFGRGSVVGPVVAGSDAEASTLIAYWLNAHEGHFVRVDVRDGSGLDAWLVQCGLKPAGPVTSMVRGDWPKAAGPAMLYAVVNQALG